MPYCIAKATRHKEGDEVLRPVVGILPSYHDESFRLRSLVFETYDEAKEAAEKAGQINPVGFVVCTIVEKEVEDYWGE